MAAPAINQTSKESAVFISEAAKTPDYYLETRPDIQAVIDARGKRILDVGCAAGLLGRALKDAGAASVTGIEQNPQAAELAEENLDHVYVGGVEEFAALLSGANFDYVILADVLEHTANPWSLLASLRHSLTDDGRVVASIPNIRFYSIIARLIFNRWGYRESGILDKTHLRFFTLPTINEMFEGAGFSVERIERKYRLFENQSRIGRVGAVASRLFCRFVAPLLWRNFFTFQYIVIAKKSV